MMMYQTVTLDSCTVFWKELGVNIDDNNVKYKAAKKWDEIEKWLEDNISISEYGSNCKLHNAYDKGIWFFRKSDAIHFKLVWSGNIV